MISAGSVTSAAAGSQGLWFVSRGSGLVLLVLLTLVMVLGMSTRVGRAPRRCAPRRCAPRRCAPRRCAPRRCAPRRWARFVTAELHRTLSLFAVALLGLHVVTAILDPYVTIGWAATVVPFLSPYHRLAIGLGTLAVDIGAAVLLTSVLRSRLGFRAWRAVHWLAYLAWPAAFLHALTAGNDMRIGWVAATVWGSAAALAAAGLAVAGLAAAGLAAGGLARARRRRAAATYGAGTARDDRPRRVPARSGVGR